MGGTLSKKRPAAAVIGGSQPFGLLSALLVAFVLGDFGADRGYIWWGIGAGLIGLAGLVAFYAALASGRMGIVSPISSLGVIVPLGLGLLAGDQPTAVQYIGILIAVIGIVLASGPELSGGADTRPVVLAFIAAVTFGFCVYCMSQGAAYSSSMTVVVMRIAQVVTMLLVALVLRTNGGLQKKDIPLLAVIGSSDALANILFTFAAPLGMLAVTSVLGSLFPVVTVLLAWWIHKERLMPVQYLGVASAMLGVIAITVG